MKRTIIAVMLLALLMPFFALAEPAPERTIQFRGLDWFISKKEAEEALVIQGAGETYQSSYVDDIYRLSAIDYTNVTMGDERVDEGGFRESYSGLDVAGYKPEVYACYYFHIEDGIIDRNPDKAVFYFGWYVFGKGDFADYAAIYDDLNAKLSSLYGEPKTNTNKYHIIATWRDKDNNILQLLTNVDKTYITLGYIAADADERLNAVQDALNAEKAAAEEAEREKNKDNTGGL